MSCRRLRSVLRPAPGMLVLATLLCCPATVFAVTRPSVSDTAPAVPVEPIRIIPTPKPIESARPYQHYEGPLSDLEVELFDDAVDSVWNHHTLLEAALIAGGVGDAERLAASTARFERLVEKAAGAIAADASAEEIATKLFDFMHREVLVGGYDLECTDLAATLEHGQFNCVSSTVLFNCLAARFGLDPVGMELPGHAMSRLRLNDKLVDVETTCPAWFRLQHDPKRRAALVAKTIGPEISVPGARPPREVASVELVAMIYYNRGVDLLTERRFAEAAAANAKALRLDPSSETARGNLLAALNNWAITVGAGHEYEKAIDLLEQGMNLDPHYETFAANYVHLYYQWAENCCSRNDYEAALEVLGQADPELLGSERSFQLRQGVYQRWARQLIQEGKSLQAAQLLRTADAEELSANNLVRQSEVPSLGEGPAPLTDDATRFRRGVDRQPRSRVLNGPSKKSS